ncbi:Neutral ceramidase [Nymphon striatum]|nr:Neutral ceramidase [Nymphon striatum]
MNGLQVWPSLLFSFAFFFLSSNAAGDIYKIGAGIADVTGPPAEVNMMGYANPSQNSAGLHFRQFSRAFIVSDNKTTVVFVSVDSCMTAQIVKIGVLKKLKEKFGDIYTEKNLVISSTHTHSTPGGFLQYLLYVITAKGFVAQSYNALVDGIARSIERAHSNIQTGHIYYNEGILLNANINRSPSSYLRNPESERKRFKHNTDKEMFVMKFVNTNQEPIGMINWFAVHGTSMNNTNKLISGDNKGYASQLFEAAMNPTALPGKGKFVAAFAQANLGDVSPNTKGPHCLNTGKPCDLLSSTCGGKNELCVAFGPGKNMFESTRIIGDRQFKKAMELYKTANKSVSGPVKFIHQYVNMAKQTVALNSTHTAKTCAPAMGVSFAAGTTDGPGAFDFKQGSKSINPLWEFVRDLLKDPSAESIKCQHPKPILLDTGHMTFPYEWDPSTVDTSIIQIGNVVAAAVPGEFTTMSGRRMREAVTETIRRYSNDSQSDLQVVIAGLSNTYSSYIATFEEYQAQRYEAASTIFGPHTLKAYLQQFSKLAKGMVLGEEMEAGPSPPNHLSVAEKYSFHFGVVFDGHPFRKSFGYALKDVRSGAVYSPNDTVTVTFVSGHPNNNLMTEGTYLTVELFDEKTQKWNVVATDSNWSTKFKWLRTSTILGESTVTIDWHIPAKATAGTYRIRHFGHYKSLFSGIHSYSGVSRKFKVKN